MRVFYIPGCPLEAPPGLLLELPVQFQVTQDLEIAAAHMMGAWGSSRATESWGE